MKVKIYNPANMVVPFKAKKQRQKPNANKGLPRNTTQSEMMRLEDMFKERIHPILGLTTDETIERFFQLPPGRILNISRYDRDKKWNKIKAIVKWLKRAKRMAIIFKSKKKGSILIHPLSEGGKARRLSRQANVYFRCMDMPNSQDFQKLLRQITGGIDQTSEDTDEIVKEELNNISSAERKTIKTVIATEQALQQRMP